MYMHIFVAQNISEGPCQGSGRLHKDWMRYWKTDLALISKPCNNLFYILSATRCTGIRCYATTDTVKLYAPLQKKVKRRSKKYAELLEGMSV